MQKKYTGAHRCQKCQKVFKWIYQDNTRKNIKSSVDEIASSFIEFPDNTKLVLSFTENNESNYDVVVNCLYCDYENRFKYAPDEE